MTQVWLLMGRSRSGLCPTRNRPDDIGFSARQLVIDCKNQRFRLDQIDKIGGQVGRSQRSAAGDSC